MAKEKKRNTPKKGLGPLDWVKIINGSTNMPEDEILDAINSYDIFIMNRLFYDIPELSKLLEIANKDGFSKLMHFKMLRSAYIAKCGRGFTKLNWKELSSTLIKKKPEIGMVMDYFKVNKGMAQKYLKLMSKKELKDIKDYYLLIESFTKTTKTKLSKKDMK